MSSQLQVSGEAKIRDIQGPVVANSGVITALDGAASQYVRGDGTLADFPTSTGGGSSVSYYLNSSVSQGTIGGVAYRELSKEPIIGAGTDIAISANGYVANYITDVNDPDVVLIPGGNFNCEFYFSVNNNSGNPFFYAELYKYDGTTFTLLGSSVGVPEYITQGTTIAPYYFAIPVATATLALTDRLAIRIYVNVSGRTITLHTENGHLCQVVTTLSKGMVSLNNLTDQSQFLTTGTSGTNFAIVSSGDTHTFNLPVASATNTGKLSSTDWSTFNGKQPAGNYVTLDTNQTITGAKIFSSNIIADGSVLLKNNVTSYLAGYVNLGGIATGYGFSVGLPNGGSPLINELRFNSSTAYNYTFPAASGTIALTSNLSSYVPYTGATQSVNLGSNSLSASALTVATNLILNSTFLLKKAGLGVTTPTYVSQFAATTGVGIGYSDGTGGGNFILQTAAIYDYTFPAITGTLALLEGTQTFTGDKLFNGSVDFNNSVNINSGLFIRNNVIGSTLYTSFTITKASSTQTLSYLFSTGFASNLLFNDAANYSYTFPTASGTIALTSNLSSYVPYTGATTNVNLGVYSLTANQLIAGSASTDNVATFSTYDQGYALKLKGSTGDLFFVPYFSPSIGARITAQNSAASANTPLSFYASNFYFNSNVNFGSTLGNGTYTYTLPSATGTLALTSNLSAYLPLTGGTLTGALNGTSATFSSSLIVGSTPILYGNVAIKSNSATSYFGLNVIANGNNNFIALNHTGSVGIIETEFSTGGSHTPMALVTGGSERMRILSNGNIGIGTSNPLSKLDVTVLSSGERRLLMNFDDSVVTIKSANSASNPENLRIIGDGITFNTGSSGSGTQKMVLTNGGNVGIGTSSPATKLHIETASQSYGQLRITSTSNNTGEASINIGRTDQTIDNRWTIGQGTASIGDTFGFYTAGSNKATLTTAGVWSTTGGGTSDLRTKDEIDYKFDNGIESILKLQPTKFKFKNAPNKQRRGFIAQDVLEVIPDLVLGDGEKENGTYGLDYDGILALAVKAIQESHQIIKDLEARIVTLESKLN